MRYRVHNVIVALLLILMGPLAHRAYAPPDLGCPPCALEILVDFGNDSSFRGDAVENPDPNGRFWNSVHAGAYYAGMVNVSNEATSMGLGFDLAPGTDSFNGPGGVFHASALGPLAVTNAVNDYYVDSRFQIQGLQTGRTYTLRFFGSHKFSTDDATTYSLCSDATYATVLRSTNLLVQTPGSPWLHNTSMVAAVSGVSPQADGIVFVRFAGANGNAGYLNAMSITRDPVSPVLGLSPSRSVVVGTSSLVVTGQLAAAGPIYPTDGDSLSVTLNGVTQSAVFSGGIGRFSTTFAIGALPVGVYPITVAYPGNGGGMLGVTNTTSSLTVTPLYRAVLIDFGNNLSFRGTNVVNPDNNGNTWNSVHSGAFYANMVDRSNQVTSVDLGFDLAPGTDSFNGPAGVFDAAALAELGATNAVNDYYINSRFQLQGLETGLTYRLTFFGSKKFSTDDATTYTLYTDNTYVTPVGSVNLNVQVPGMPWLHNSNTVAVLDGVVPRPDGKLFIGFAGAGGNSGFLNALKVEWERASAAINGVTLSQSIPYGTASVTLTGIVTGAGSVYPTPGESVSVTINGTTQPATIGAAGAFSVSFPVSSLPAAVHTVTYAYPGSTVLAPATNTTTAITVTKVTPVITVHPAPSTFYGAANITLTGLVSAAGPVPAPNGGQVQITVNGVTQSASIAGGAGAFSVAFPVSTLATGSYPVTYAYMGSASSHFGATNDATALTITPVYRMLLIDLGNNLSFRGTNVVNPDANGNTWNSVHSGAFYANMVDRSNQVTAVDLGFDLAPGTDSFNGPAGVLDAAALGELGATNAVNDYYINSRFQLQGLETGLTYRLTFFGSKKFSTDDATTYTLYTDNTYASPVGSVNLNVQVPGMPWLHNSNTVAVMDGVVPRTDGKIFIGFVGAGGNSGFLNALKVEWERAAAVISGVTPNQSVSYGTSSIALTGIVSAGNAVFGRSGDTLSVTINGTTLPATFGAGGAFSVTFPTATLPAGAYGITYSYAGSSVLTPASHAGTTVSVTRLATSIQPVAGAAVESGTAQVTLTGQVVGVGGFYPSAGESVSVSINGGTQVATVSGSVGAFSVSYPVSGFSVGVYPVTYTYAGNAAALLGATNTATALTIQVDAQSTTILLDLGRHDGVNGNATTSPDANTNHWNNISSRAADNVVTNGTRTPNLVTIGGQATPVAVRVTSAGWLANGRLNGGLFSPNGPAPALLGRFAVESATEDYFFVSGAGVSQTLAISGLNPARAYNLRFFGTRENAQTRITTFSADGQSVAQTTSGSGIANNGIYSGNDDEIGLLTGVEPDGNGELSVSVQATTGGFGYLGILEIVDAAGHCLNGTPLTLPAVADQVVYANGSASLVFNVTARDAEGCVAPTLSSIGLPSGAAFNTTSSTNVVTGTFSWTPTIGQAGTYPVRFMANDVNESGSVSRVVMIRVGVAGEGNTGGVPNSQTNWHVAITDLAVPSSGNATLVWEAVDGMAYDVYRSTAPVGGGASWSKVVDGSVAAGANATSAVSPGSMVFYQVVPQGQTPGNNGLWGMVAATVGSSFHLMAPPLVGDRRFDGEMGAAMAAVMPDGTQIHLMNAGANPTWQTLELSNGQWLTEPGGAVYSTALGEGEGFFVQGAAGTSPVFSGPVGNEGDHQQTLAVGYNLIGLSRGKSLAVAQAFQSITPVASYNEDAADQLIVANPDGSWRRMVRLPTGVWYDLSTGSTASQTLTPGQAYYYIRRSSNTTITF